MVPITSEDMERFHEHAMAALARRGRGYMMDEVFGGLQTALLGVLPIVGMLFGNWSGIEMFAFLMVSLWCGIGCDVTKFLWLEERARAFADARFNDWHVWSVVDALRAGRETMPKQTFRARWQPWNGVFCDIVIGLVSTLLIRLMTALPDGRMEPGLLRLYPSAIPAASAPTCWEQRPPMSTVCRKVSDFRRGVFQ
jgi:hypothetical protein